MDRSGTRQGWRKLAAGLCALAIAAAPHAARTDEADQAFSLLSYFSSGCPSQGEWTQAALSQTEALISVFKAIKDDPNCQTLAGSLGQLQFLNQRVHALQSKQAERDILRLKREQQELLAQLVNTTDPAQAEAIQARIFAIQMELASQKGYQSADGEGLATQETEMLGSLIQGTEAVFNQAVANTACLQGRPEILPGLASLAGSVAMGAASPAISVGIGAGITLLGKIVEFIRTKGISDKIHQGAKIVADSAYQCALEALANRWCAAQDSVNLIDTLIKYDTVDYAQEPVWKGIKVLNGEFPRLLGFLEKVKAGAEPTDEAAAQAQKAVIEKRAAVEASYYTGLGAINQYSKFWVGAPEDQRWNALLTIIGRVLVNLGAEPFWVILKSPEYAPYYFLGVPFKDMPKDATGNPKSIGNIDPTSELGDFVANFTPAYVTVRFRELVKLAQDRVALELSTVLQPDPLLTVQAAKLESGADKESAYGAAREVIDFLRRYAPKQDLDPIHAIVFRNTIERLEEMVRQIDLLPAKEQECAAASPPIPDCLDKAAGAILSEIFFQGRLEHGATLIRNRVETSVQLSLTALLVDGGGGSLPPDVVAKLLASQDMLQEFRAFAGKDKSKKQMKGDAKNSQDITRKNLDLFVSVFAKGIREVTRDYLKKAKDPIEDQEFYRAQRAMMCLKLLAVPRLPEDLAESIGELCEGAGLVSEYPAGPKSVKVTAKLWSTPHRDRVCSLRDFFRAEAIYEDLQGRGRKLRRDARDWLGRPI